MAFEKLNFPFVLFRLLSRFERAQVAAFSRLRVSLSRIEPVSTRFEFSNHN
jgi:hypothetical protein